MAIDESIPKFQMSPVMNNTLEMLPAFVVYSSKNKKKRQRNRKNSTNAEEIMITEEQPEVEEIHKEINRPTTSGISDSVSKRKKINKILINSTPSRQSKSPCVEVIDIDENSSDVLPMQTAGKGKKKKRIIEVCSESEDEIIVEAMNKRKNGVQELDSSKGKKRKKNVWYVDSLPEGQDISIIEDDNKEEEAEEVEEDDDDDETEENISGNSIQEGKRLLGWLMNPVSPDEFYSSTWEKRPLHIKRGIPEYFKPLLSTQDIDKMLRNNYVQFTKNLDVTSYSDGKRETHNPDGRALPNVVWDYYKNGCSVRLLNPQTFIPKIALLNASLQEYFGCFVGANVYLTPPDSQGFAPHYDDIEAFILQIEGLKRWKLYAPKSESETLPRFSSGNFQQDEIGDPIMDIILQPGDLIYFPRGTIHQGRSVSGSHSLHITVSTFQRNTWGDLMEKVIGAAVRVAMEENLEYRKGLPLDYLNYMGIAHSDESSSKRNEFIAKIKSLTTKLFDHAPIDAAVDQMGKQFMHDALPPVLNPEEKQCSSFGDGYKMGPSGKLNNGGELKLKTKIKLLRAHVLRLVSEEDTVRVYHNVDNSLEYHGEEPQYLEIPYELAPAVEHLIRSYPEFTKISDLPLEANEQKMLIAGDLWDRGLILTELPLKKNS